MVLESVMGSVPEPAEVEMLLQQSPVGNENHKHYKSIVVRPPMRAFDLHVGSQGYNYEQAYLIKGYLPSESFGVLFGPSGSYKSFHAVAWAASIATGKPWNGCRSSKGAVIYVVGEGGAGVPRRIKGWEKEHNEGRPIENLFTIKHPVFVGSNGQVEALINTVKEAESRSGEKVKVIFLDTLARCFAGADENRAADMNLFIAGCDKVKAETGASVVVIHHSGKNGEAGARGSSALKAASDFEFRLSRPDGEQLYVLTHTKSKDSEEQPPTAFDMHEKFLYLDSDGDEVNTLVASIDGREPPDDPEDTGAKNLSANHEALWQAVRSRMAKGRAY